MIQAGTIRTGSGWTLSVDEEYWISSISSLRNTTLPRAVATVSPTTKSRSPPGGLPADSKRIQSQYQFCQPNTKFSPPLWNAFCNTSGLVTAKLDGASISSTCRTENSTTASFAGATPRTPDVALCHHCSFSRNACASKLNGGRSHSGSVKRRSCGFGLIRDHGP